MGEAARRRDYRLLTTGSDASAVVVQAKAASFDRPRRPPPIIVSGPAWRARKSGLLACVVANQ